MLKIEHTEVVGWEHAIRGMRNPMNSWDKSDSNYARCGLDRCGDCPLLDTQERDCGWNLGTEPFRIGYRDMALMKQLAQAGTDHRKFMRMIVVYCDITAPLYWWKEYDTYKVGTVANSCSTMHKIHSKELTLEDFSCEHLGHPALTNLRNTIKCINDYREEFLKDSEKRNWWQIIQLLPTSYNQKRTVMLNYEVLSNIYKSRKNHKLDEWREMCHWIESLPYSQLITGKEGEADGKPEDHEGDCEENSGGIPVLPEQ